MGMVCRDASAFHKKIIESMGGIVEDTFGEHCTHLIWSHGTSKRMKLAAIMDIYVVSPLWIEQCRQAKKRVSELDFLASDDVPSAIPSTQAATRSAPISSPVASIVPPTQTTSSAKRGK